MLGSLVKLCAVLACMLCVHTGTCANESPQQRPNVLLIMSDDMGFSDLGCYGGEARTPNLDTLAANGVRFTQFYNGARCCPTRASLLTGLYAHQTGVGHMTHNDRGWPGYHAELNNQCATIAEVLGDSGYRTYMVGKWHVNRHERPDGPKYNWPLQRGFEKYYGIIWGSSSFFDPAICRGNTWYSRESDPEYKPEKFYLTNAFTDNAIMFLQQHDEESPGKPFFMYVAYTAAHWPMHALEEDIAKYKGRFDAGYDKLREERVKRLREKGLINPAWDIGPTAEKWENVQNREWELRCMEVYAAMIDSMDQGIGKIVAELKRQGQLENTLIMFLQDNGGCAEEMGRKPDNVDPNNRLSPLKPEQLPVGDRHPRQTRDGRPVQHGPAIMPGSDNSYIAYGRGWANVSNTPFREYKHWVHEGGISSPLIVHWPKGIAEAQRNKLASDPAHIIDIMATCVDVVHATYPSERKRVKITPMEGISLRPALHGEHLQRSEPLFWEHEGNRAVRESKWKLVAKEDQPWELYDMEADRTEMHDLANDKPELVRELSDKWDKWAARANVLPLGAWKTNAPHETSGSVSLQLKQGQIVPAKEAPPIENRALTITVEIQEPRGDGVLVAHGGSKHGYALVVQEGKLQFIVRRNGELTSLADASPLGDAPTTVRLVLNAAGEATLSANEREVAKGPVGKLMRTPADDLSAGQDYDDPVGTYQGTFSYSGKLGRIQINIGDPE